MNRWNAWNARIRDEHRERAAAERALWQCYREGDITETERDHGIAVLAQITRGNVAVLKALRDSE